jgi:hypothetical protein
MEQMREISSGGSYLSQSEVRANFGLGHATEAERVEINWPSGQRDVFSHVQSDKFYLVEEGSHELRLQKFSRPSAKGK